MLTRMDSHRQAFFFFCFVFFFYFTCYVHSPNVCVSKFPALSVVIWILRVWTTRSWDWSTRNQIECGPLTSILEYQLTGNEMNLPSRFLSSIYLMVMWRVKYSKQLNHFCIEIIHTLTLVSVWYVRLFNVVVCLNVSIVNPMPVCSNEKFEYLISLSVFVCHELAD